MEPELFDKKSFESYDNDDLVLNEDDFYDEDVVDNVKVTPSKLEDCYLSTKELIKFQAPSVVTLVRSW